MNLSEAICFVERTTGSRVDKTSREKFRQALQILGQPHKKIKTFHIAGTNGKGAVSMMLTNGIIAYGNTVGTYMSPFVYDVRERWLVDGKPVSEDKFIESVQLVKRAIEQVEHGKPTISTFEIKTLVAFVIFTKLNLDYIVLEVGIGGLLDATNVIPAPIAAVITSIGFDHVDLLGPTLQDIAFQKAGIIKAKTGIVVCGDTNPDVQTVVSQVAATSDVSVEFVTPLINNNLALPGEHQRMNAAVALTALDSHFGDVPASVYSAVIATTLPGRFEHKKINRRDVVFDGAHNQAAAKALKSAITDRFPGKKVTLVVAHSGNHDSACFGSELLDVIDDVFVTCTPFRPQSPEPTAVYYKSMQKIVTVVMEPDTAISLAVSNGSDDKPVIVSGSFYLARSFLSCVTAD